MGFGRLGTDGVEGMFGSTREHTGHVADLPARLDLGILDVDGFDRACTFAVQLAQVGARRVVYHGLVVHYVFRQGAAIKVRRWSGLPLLDGACVHVSPE